MPPLSKELRNQLAAVTLAARTRAEAAAQAALENLAVHEREPRAHMTVEQRKLRNRLRARGRALGDVRDEHTGLQNLRHLVESTAYEHWHRLLFTRFLTGNNLLLMPDDAGGDPVPVSLEDCEELAPEMGARDGFDLACRFAGRTLPGVFRRDDPSLELSLALNDQVELVQQLGRLPKDVFTASDSLGWTYQFWQTQRKKEVNESGVKIGPDELSPVTQLFTEDYMVDFLLDNTLGAWHAGRVLAANPKLAETAQSEDELRQSVSLPGCPWKYLRFIKGQDGKWTPAAGTFDGWPKTAKELKCLDPCMGSGHFVVAMFERLVALRMAEGKLDEKTAVAAVIRDNLFGLELDPRCTQIGAFNLALAAWRRVGHCALPAMNLACSGLAPNTKLDDWLKLAGDNEKLRNGMERLFNLFEKAPVLGSLINPRHGADDMFVADYHEVSSLLQQALQSEFPSSLESAVTARGLAKAAEILAGQFTLVATNVPYLGRSKQDDTLMDYCEIVYPEAKADLATCFVERCLDFSNECGSIALVTPQNWLFQKSYINLRLALLKNVSWNTLVRLGEHAFESSQAAGAFVTLVGLTHRLAPTCHTFLGIDATHETTPQSKAAMLHGADVIQVSQSGQMDNPDQRLVFGESSSSKLLGEYAESVKGLTTGDGERFILQYWELSTKLKGWEWFQSTVKSCIDFGGLHQIYLWEDGCGDMQTIPGSRTYARGAWNTNGVLVSQMRQLPATRYFGCGYDNNCAVLKPNKKEYLPALWMFSISGEFSKEVRRIDVGVKATNASFEKVPFDLAHWQKVAAEKYPHGLPKPFSSDPTQWLFNGHPNPDHPSPNRPKDAEGNFILHNSSFILQVAVARLCGYQWPRQTGSSFPDCPALAPDGLESFADDDGVVCLPPLNREQPAAARLRSMLAAALGKFDERALLASAGSKGSKSTTLEEWLRDEFFEQHCDLFHQRPFIWHVWDGLKDGFHALVHYHRLDNGLLQKLAYTYVGDWIRQQSEDAKADRPGAAARLGAAQALQQELAKILEGEAPYDLFTRWKGLSSQPSGWHPDLNDGVRLNIRPFLQARDVGKKGAGVLRSKPGIKWDKDRGKEPVRDKTDYPWFWCEEEPGTDPIGGKGFSGNRWNDVHLTLVAKRAMKERV